MLFIFPANENAVKNQQSVFQSNGGVLIQRWCALKLCPVHLISIQFRHTSNFASGVHAKVQGSSFIVQQNCIARHDILCTKNDEYCSLRQIQNVCRFHELCRFLAFNYKQTLLVIMVRRPQPTTIPSFR